MSISQASLLWSPLRGIADSKLRNSMNTTGWIYLKKIQLKCFSCLQAGLHLLYIEVLMTEQKLQYTQIQKQKAKPYVWNVEKDVGISWILYFMFWNSLRFFSVTSVVEFCWRESTGASF